MAYCFKELWSYFQEEIDISVCNYCTVQRSQSVGPKHHLNVKKADNVRHKQIKLVVSLKPLWIIQDIENVTAI